jgi:L-ascorbate metabolism protein UlaG (beta-lactamase superfamily)
MRSKLILAGIALISLTLISAKSSKQESENAKSKWGRHSAMGGGTVKITPIGSHQGELCRNDRALVLRDPTGVTLLWDPGRTVYENDARLGDVHALLLSSMHADHLGDAKPNPVAPGTCAAPSTISTAPNPTAATIAAAKNAAVIVGGEMGDYLARKIQNVRGTPTASCPTSGPDNETIVPMTAPCVGTLRPGGSRTVRLAGASSGVRIANIPAFHSNGIPAALLDSPGVAPGTSAYGGPDGGAVVQFTNGLTVYLSADTGLSADMELIIRRFYQPDLVVLNVGDVFCLGPEEGAYAINSLLKPSSVIPSHINEAATAGGQIVGNRLRLFLEQVDRKVDVVIPLSGITREFDGRGRCVRGC